MSYHLKLIKGLSYYGLVQATKKDPDVFTEDKATADKAVATGYFRLVEDKEKVKKQPPENGKELEEMTVAELETYAAYKGISLEKISKKTDIIAKLKEELGTEETENKVVYGSPTMTELQQQ